MSPLKFIIKKSNFASFIVETFMSADSFTAATFNVQPFVLVVEFVVVSAFRHQLVVLRQINEF